MKIAYRLPAAWTILVLLSVGPALAQRGGPPRRLVDPQTIRLERGSRVEFREFHSPALGKTARYSIFLPAGYDRHSDRRYPAIYFLHGMFNDHTSWAVERYGNLPARVETLMAEGKAAETILVFPDGENSFYTDSLDGRLRYETFISTDLIHEVESSFRTAVGRSNRAIAGTSMGGYGALKIALKNPGIFAAVAAGSPIIFLGEDPSRQITDSDSRMAQFFARLVEPVFGIPFDPDHWRANSVESLCRTGDPDGLKILFAYGTADRYQQAFPLAEGIQAVDRILTRRGIPHVFKVYEGEPHGWALIRAHLEEFLGFLGQTF